MRFTVTIEAHRVADRYDIPASEKIIGAESAPKARMIALRYAHSDAGVPPWKPYLRESWPHTSAAEYVMTKDEIKRQKMRERAGGGSR